jgi:hypothetical protein
MRLIARISQTVDYSGRVEFKTSSNKDTNMVRSLSRNASQFEWRAT